jgi:DinB superfamily
LRKCVRDFYSLAEVPATESRKENLTIFLSTGLSTHRTDSCTEVINFSTVEAPILWTLKVPSKAADGLRNRTRLHVVQPPSEAVQPQPDTKDWTWVLTQRCDQCGLSVGEIKREDFAPRAFVAAEEWVQILRSSPAVTARPQPDVWSPLEYGAHVRDVYRLFDARLVQMLTEDNPTFAYWNQDETAINERYREQDPEVVADELEAAAQGFVARIQSLTAEQYRRRGMRSDGAEFTVATFLQYFLHDVIHHLWDVTGQQDAAASLALE